MPAPWITDAELKDALAAALGVDPTELVIKWDTIIPTANRKAGADISSLLAAKGYTASQLDAWDWRKEYNTDQGVFWCGVDGSSLINVGIEEVKMRDRREDIKKLTPTSNGIPMFPAATSADGQSFSVATGRIDESYYRFSADKEF